MSSYDDGHQFEAIYAALTKDGRPKKLALYVPENEREPYELPDPLSDEVQAYLRAAGENMAPSKKTEG